MAEKPLGPKAQAYLRVWEAYIKAPRQERDEMLVRDLCDAALDELVKGTTVDVDRQRPCDRRRSAWARQARGR